MPKILTPAEIMTRAKAGEKAKDIFFDAAGNRIAKAVGVSATVVVRDLLASDDRSVEFTISTGALDRYNSTIAPDGWQIADFEKNPVVLWAHDDSIPAIGRAEMTRIEGNRLRSRAVFADAEFHPLADTIFRLIKGRFIGAASVGWIPLEYKFVEGGDRGFGIDYLAQELLEWSVVNIPANPECLVGARSFGIDTRPLLAWAERALDQGGLVAVPRDELEALRKAAGAPKVFAAPKFSFIDPPEAELEIVTLSRALNERLAKRGGKVLSSDNAKCLREADDHMQAAHDHHEACRDHCAKASEMVRSVLDKNDEPDDGDDTEQPTGAAGDREQRSRRLRVLRLRSAS